MTQQSESQAMAHEATLFVMLRLGECCLEIGDEKNATEYLLRAYMFEGREIFEPDEDGNDDGKKYFDYLRTHVENIE